MAYATERLGLSQRRACALTGISPSIYRYRSQLCDDDVLRRRMRELAGERKRFGSPRLERPPSSAGISPLNSLP